LQEEFIIDKESEDMNPTDGDHGSKSHLSSSSSPLTASKVQFFPEAKDGKPSEASSHPAELSDVSNTNNSNSDHPSSRSTAICVSDEIVGVRENSKPVPFPNATSLNEDHDSTLAPSTNTIDESQLLSETAIHVNSASNDNSTKSRFRAARAVLPGAVASSPTNSTTASTGTDRLPQEGISHLLPVSQYPTALSLEEQNFHDDIGIVEDEGDNGASESFFKKNDNATSDETPCIVIAEVVKDEATLDQNERKRIVEETIESITNQAATAEVVTLEGDKSSHKYRAVILVLTFIVIVFVVVLVVVLKTRDSDTTNDLTTAPTLSPTSYLDPSVFRTIEELYRAVDAYRMSFWNDTNQSSFESSEVALRYGYPISSWNVSLITNFSWVFDVTRFAADIPWEFNEDLGNWDVSNAELMVGMFANAYEFQGLGLENWNVGRVRDFSSMFMYSGFNVTVSGWDTSNAENMDNMFAGAYSFNDDLSMWNVSQVRSMNSMFYYASSFEGSGLEYWDVQYVRDFSSMFSGATKFNGNVSSWNTSNAEITDSMFSYAAIFNDNLSFWDVSKVTNMVAMFSSASAFTGGGIANWDVSKVTAMDAMFSSAVLFDEDLSQWDVSQVLSLSAMVSTFCPCFLSYLARH
jgi:Mycoplasma protein of unknown function, DUF285